MLPKEHMGLHTVEHKIPDLENEVYPKIKEVTNPPEPQHWKSVVANNSIISVRIRGRPQGSPRRDVESLCKGISFHTGKVT